MPNIFKALASVTAWVLFIGGCFSLVIATITWATMTDIFEANTALAINFLVIVVWLVGGVVVMRLRQKME